MSDSDSGSDEELMKCLRGESVGPDAPPATAPTTEEADKQDDAGNPEGGGEGAQKRGGAIAEESFQGGGVPLEEEKDDEEESQGGGQEAQQESGGGEQNGAPRSSRRLSQRTSASVSGGQNSRQEQQSTGRRRGRPRKERGCGDPALTDHMWCTQSGCYRYKRGEEWLLRSELGNNRGALISAYRNLNPERYRKRCEEIKAEREGGKPSKARKSSPSKGKGASKVNKTEVKKNSASKHTVSRAKKRKRAEKTEEKEEAASIEAGLFLDEASITLLKFLQSDSFQVMVEYKLESHLQQAREALQQAVKAAKAAGLEISDVKNIVDLTQ
jgi:hypothetical protein